MKHHDRVTFSQGYEVLEHAVEYLTHICGVLEATAERDMPQRERMLLDAYRVEQRNLLGAIERYQADAPERALATYTQYVAELPAELAGPEKPMTTLSLTQWLLALNQHLVTLFTELAESGKNDALGSIFSGLAEQVQAHDRRISKEYQRFEDL